MRWLLRTDHLTVNEMTRDEEQKEDIGPASLSPSCSPPSPATCECRGPSAALPHGSGTAGPGSSWNLWRPRSDIFPPALIQPSVAASPTGNPHERTPLPRLRLWERENTEMSHQSRRCVVAQRWPVAHGEALDVLTWFLWFHSSNNKNVEADSQKCDHSNSHVNAAELKPFRLSFASMSRTEAWQLYHNESIHTT